MGYHNLEIIGGLFFILHLMAYYMPWLCIEVVGYSTNVQVLTELGQNVCSSVNFHWLQTCRSLNCIQVKRKETAWFTFLPRKVWSGGFFFFSPQNLKVASTILLFGAIQNVVRTIEFRKFRIQQKIGFGGGSGSFDTSSKADGIRLRRLFILLINIKFHLKTFTLRRTIKGHHGSEFGTNSHYSGLSPFQVRTILLHTCWQIALFQGTGIYL